MGDGIRDEIGDLASEVAGRHDDVPYVGRVFGDEQVAPFVDGNAELGAAGRRFGLSRQRVKAEIAPAHGNRLHLGAVGRSDLAGHSTRISDLTWAC